MKKNNNNDVPEQPKAPNYHFERRFKNDDPSNNNQLPKMTPAEEEAEIERLEDLEENAQFQRGSALGDQYH